MWITHFCGTSQKNKTRAQYPVYQHLQHLIYGPRRIISLRFSLLSPLVNSWQFTFLTHNLKVWKPPQFSQINPGKLYKEGRKKKKLQTTHCEYILTILGLFWSQINSLQSSHKKWILFPSYTEPTVSEQCGISLHPKPHCHEKPIWKPLKSSSFSSVGSTLCILICQLLRENYGAAKIQSLLPDTLLWC